MNAPNREAWPQLLVTQLRPLYGDELPAVVHVSVGFSSKGKRSNRVGECWSAEASADSAPQIFIHPGVGDAVDVAAIMVHELIHACGIHGHGADFRSRATDLGLVGRMTATDAGDALKGYLVGVVEVIGPYPHPKLSPGSFREPLKQSTRMLKVECPGCGYTARTSQKWIDVGLPSCPEGDRMELAS